MKYKICRQSVTFTKELHQTTFPFNNNPQAIANLLRGATNLDSETTVSRSKKLPKFT